MASVGWAGGKIDPKLQYEQCYHGQYNGTKGRQKPGLVSKQIFREPKRAEDDARHVYCPHVLCPVTAFRVSPDQEYYHDAYYINDKVDDHMIKYLSGWFQHNLAHANKNSKTVFIYLYLLWRLKIFMQA